MNNESSLQAQCWTQGSMDYYDGQIRKGIRPLSISRERWAELQRIPHQGDMLAAMRHEMQNNRGGKLYG